MGACPDCLVDSTEDYDGEGRCWTCYASGSATPATTNGNVVPLAAPRHTYVADSRNKRNKRNIDGLLRDVERHVRRYVVLPGEHEKVAVVLFVVHTWAFASAHATPYLVAQSPEKQSGKTRFLEVIGVLVHEPLHVASASEAALYRTIEATRCTLLLDEVDAIFAQNTERTEALRGLINSGNRASGRAIRCVGQSQEARSFSTFCPKVLAGIDEGRLPDTILDRSIEIRMKRKLPGERVERFRERTAIADTEALLGQLADWAVSVEEALRDAEPVIPDGLGDRAAEAWEPLFAIADMAGGEWPRLARAAATALSGDDADEDMGSPGRRLLAAIRKVWPAGDTDRLASVDLCHRLNADPELPYGAWSEGKGIKPNTLAKYLRPYGITSATMRIGTATPKGYARDRFREAWERYLPRDVADVADVAAIRQVDIVEGFGGVA